MYLWSTILVLASTHNACTYKPSISQQRAAGRAGVTEVRGCDRYGAWRRDEEEQHAHSHCAIALRGVSGQR